MATLRALPFMCKSRWKETEILVKEKEKKKSEWRARGDQAGDGITRIGITKLDSKGQEPIGE